MSRSDSGENLAKEKPGTANAASPASRSRRPLIIGGIVAGAIVVFALALGLGLGLGLKRHRSSSNSSSPSSGSNGTGSLAVAASPDSGAAFMSTSLMNDAPTTRTYDFVVEERMGSPDGVEKRMLVVNGQFPGPTIEVNSGDRVVVNVTNKMSNAT